MRGTLPRTRRSRRRASGDNTIIELTDEDAQTIHDAVAEMTKAYMDRALGEAASEAMQNGVSGQGG